MLLDAKMVEKQARLCGRPQPWTRIVPSIERQPNAFDDDGFLADVGAWNRDLAVQIAAEHCIAGMTQAHWAVICYLRGHYLREGTLPGSRTSAGSSAWKKAACTTCSVGR